MQGLCMKSQIYIPVSTYAVTIWGHTKIVKSKRVYFVSQFAVFHLFSFNASGTVCLSDLEMGHVLKYSHLHNDLNKNKYKKKSIWSDGISNLNYMLLLSVLLCFESLLTDGTEPNGKIPVSSILFYEITNRCSYMQSILFHC